jgi:signal transduction histidine kinase
MPTAADARPPLWRPRVGVLGGVCAGVARHLGWSVSAVRWLAVGLAVCGGAGVLLYAWLWALVPLEPPHDEKTEVRRALPVTWLRFGGGGALLAVALIVPSVVGVHSIAGVVWVVVALCAAALVLLGPWGVRLWHELIAERTARVREEQRAEIAAHLHDSVLQTLALIQNRAGASSEVARIARAQERELREWLYAGGGVTARDLGADLREFAAALELEHEVRFDVVTVGEADETGLHELAAAAREAMLNAARHAGGDVSVYVEATASIVDVFVRDRGAGFDLDEVPSDRLGVRESIIGRMRRAGGSGEVRRTAGGTEVHLRLERGKPEGADG